MEIAVSYARAIDIAHIGMRELALPFAGPGNRKVRIGSYAFQHRVLGPNSARSRFPENPNGATSMNGSQQSNSRRLAGRNSFGEAPAVCKTGTRNGAYRRGRIRFLLLFHTICSTPGSMFLQGFKVPWPEFLTQLRPDAMPRPPQNQASRNAFCRPLKSRRVMFAVSPIGNHTRPQKWLPTGHGWTF